MPPQLPGKSANQGGEHGPVRPGQPRPTDLATQYGDFVAQHQELGGPRRIAAGRPAVTSRTSGRRSRTSGGQTCPRSCVTATECQLTSCATVLARHRLSVAAGSRHVPRPLARACEQLGDGHQQPRRSRIRRCSPPAGRAPRREVAPSGRSPWVQTQRIMSRKDGPAKARPSVDGPRCASHEVCHMTGPDACRQIDRTPRWADRLVACRWKFGPGSCQEAR